MKLRKIAALAAGAGLAAGMLVIGSAPAHAQVDTYLECDEVAGDAKLKPGLASAPLAVTVGVKSRKAPAAGSSAVCSADGGTPWAALNGTATDAVKGKVSPGFRDSTKSTANGGISCVTGNSTYSASGKLVIKMATLDAGGKNFASTGYIRLLGSPDPLLQPDTVSIIGIVTKGVGLGADINADLLQQPTGGNDPAGAITGVPGTLIKGKKQLQADPSNPVPSAVQGVSNIVPGATGGRVAPGVLSAVIGQVCQAGAGDITETVFGTDGMSAIAFAADAGLASALGNIQTECVTDPPSGACLAALGAFGAAYVAAYGSGNYDTDSSISLTVPA